MLDRLTAETIAAREAELLRYLPASGAIGNMTLIRQLSLLGWNEPLYWAVRNGMVEKKVIELSRGRGGSIRRVVHAELSDQSSKPSDPQISDTLELIAAWHADQLDGEWYGKVSVSLSYSEVDLRPLWHVQIKVAGTLLDLKPFEDFWEPMEGHEDSDCIDDLAIECGVSEGYFTAWCELGRLSEALKAFTEWASLKR